MTVADPTLFACLPVVCAFVRLLNAARPVAIPTRSPDSQPHGILYPSCYGFELLCNGLTYARWHPRFSAVWSYLRSYSPMKGQRAEHN